MPQPLSTAVSPALRLACVAAELGLLVAAAAWMRAESPGLPWLLGVAAGLFVVHAIAPPAWRERVFLSGSLAGGALVVAHDGARGGFEAAGLLEAALFVALLLLLGLFFLLVLERPWPALVRVAVLLAAGGALAFLRFRQFVLSDEQWRVLGATFMFRLIVYAYEVIASRRRERLQDGLSYLFFLPTFHFPLLPVVDYATFKRSRVGGGNGGGGEVGRGAAETTRAVANARLEDGELLATAQRGVQWMALGLLELALYRLVYHRVALAGTEVESWGSLTRFLLAPYLLYTNVAGQFHLIVGMLHLFGFKLPEPSRNWLLAHSFTDFWRRINVYWKDFVARVFWFPAFFRLRRRSEGLALVAATAAAFVATALLHGYQSFWLRGEFALTPGDALFWGVLGAAVVFGLLREAGPSLSPRGAADGGAADGGAADAGATAGLGNAVRARGPSGMRRVLSIAGVWLVVSLLWSIWSSPSIAEWWEAVARGSGR
jgi:hypothetical protein